VEYYLKGNYHRIDGDRDPEMISTELLTILGRAKTSAAA
jgi:hypothetical protein